MGSNSLWSSAYEAYVFFKCHLYVLIYIRVSLNKYCHLDLLLVTVVHFQSGTILRKL